MPSGYYDPAMHRAVAAAEERSFWARSRNELIVWTLRRYFPKARSLLDVGCGIGIVLAAIHEALPQLGLVGCDIFAPAVAEARRRLPDIEIHEIGAVQLSFDGRFDVVTALDVLEHLNDDRAALLAIRRSIRPGGGLVVAVPQHRWLWSAADDWAEHRRRYRRSELLSLLVACGFDVVRMTSFVALPLPALWLARMRSRRQEQYDPLAELSLPRRLDAMLGSVLALERAAIRAGASFPAGGSLLAVARRAEREPAR
jgi:2-polyprenyl-3-methyl-5-hydroxy-6-metoxy-1,4-benzoquinol methylase